MTDWDNLPNAKHIDRILADVKINPEKWNAAVNGARNVAGDDAWDAARNATINAARNAAWDAAWDAVRSAIIALVAYDDCAYLLDEKPEDVKMLALLGNTAAILLYPACVVLQKEKMN